MEFHVFQCRKDQDYFIVTDAAHVEQLYNSEVCPTKGDTLKKIGVFGEMGEERVAFNEGLAKRTIAEHGYYRFELLVSDDEYLGRPDQVLVIVGKLFVGLLCL